MLISDQLYKAASTHRFDHQVSFLVVKPVTSTHDEKVRSHITVFAARNETSAMCGRRKVTKTSFQTKFSNLHNSWF